MALVLITELWVDRSTRQRKELNNEHIDALADSFRRIGQLTAITYKPSGEIIFGEHRFEAAKLLGWTHIKAELEENTDSNLIHAMELEENIKRLDLDWHDKAAAIYTYHKNRLEADSTWTQLKTGEALGLDAATVSRNIAVALEITEGNEKISSAPHVNAAYNILARRESRERESEEVRAFSTERASAAKVITPGSSVLTTAVASAPTPTEPDVIQNLNFLKWAPQYAGPKFNFLHCDFPYGVGLHKSDQMGSGFKDIYEDKPETYWTLLNCLADNIDKFLLPSAHIVFWFSMDFYTETRAFFAERIPSFDIDSFPLYWLKTDGKGILPDPNRGPRRIVETALFGRRGDRKIVQAVANGYGCPTQKATNIHISEKPEPMLRHFFRMLVDENTAILDPTCGSGSALRAADSLNAALILGLELNPEHAAHANVAFKRARSLRNI